MVDAAETPGRNVIDFAGYQRSRQAAGLKAQAMSARLCRHCGAALGEGDSDDDCSSLGIDAARPVPPMPRRMFRAE